MKMKRNRKLYAGCIMIVILLGLLSRRFGAILPPWAAAYAGDLLWGMMIFLMTVFLFHRKNTIPVAAMAYVFSVIVETSQLYHAPWIDAIRANRLGGLVLGYGFLWSDLLCYLAGVLMGVLLEKLFYNK
jgi:hypothetical protein